MTDHVHTTLDRGVLTLTLDRPEKKNALTDAMYAVLADGLARADADAEVGAVLITSAGDAFTAGNDLADFAAVAEGTLGERQVGRFLRGLATLGAPLVAAVPGLAVGVGTTMLLHCDLVYLAEGATLSTPFVDLALVPEAGSSLLLPQRIGHARAFAMFGLGERVGAEDAVRWGLANRVLPADRLQGEALAAAHALCAKPRDALRHAKALMRPQTVLRETLERETAIFNAQLKSPEAAQAFAAFAARRRPG